MKQPTSNAEMPELLSDLAEKTAEILRESIEIDPATASHIGVKLARSIAEKWKKQLVYIPEGLGMYIHERDLQIYKEFNGSNHAELARKYKISMQWVYAIVKKMQAIRAREVQPELFEK